VPTEKIGQKIFLLCQQKKSEQSFLLVQLVGATCWCYLLVQLVGATF
jgi:hypothetical protein